MGATYILENKKDVFVLFVFLYLLFFNVETTKNASLHSTKLTKANRFYKPKEIKVYTPGGRSARVEVQMG